MFHDSFFFLMPVASPPFPKGGKLKAETRPFTTKEVAFHTLKCHLLDYRVFNDVLSDFISTVSFIC